MSKQRPGKPQAKTALEQPARKHSSVILSITFLLFAIAYGMYKANSYLWLTDDTFVTLRYIKHFLNGDGLVYNTGEYVEGYTHFLWLIILAVSTKLGWNVENAAMWLGVLSYAAIIALLGIITLKRFKATHTIFLPFAALAVALHYDMNVWASGGLETSFFAFLILLTFYVYFYSKVQNKLLVVSLLLTLLYLTRPDGILFLILADVLLFVAILKKQKDWKTLLTFNILPVSFGAIYLWWKYSYYGDLFPNTYYVKSGDESYFSQGFFYLWLYFKVYFTSILFLSGLLFLFLRNRKNYDTQPSSLPLPLLVAISATLFYLIAYVAKVGGDFMFARFIIPVVPLIYYSIEEAIAFASDQYFKKISLALPLLLLGTLLYENYHREDILFEWKDGELKARWDGGAGGETRGVVDERWVYNRSRFSIDGFERGSLEVYSSIGKYYEPFFEGLHTTVAIKGAQNTIAYYSDIQNVILEPGLTDKYIAHLPIKQRGRIGHEKIAPIDYLIKKNTLFRLLSPTNKLPREGNFNLAFFELPELGLWQPADIIVYDKEVMQELRKRFKAAGSRTILPEFEKLIFYYIKSELPKRTRTEAETEYKKLKDFYFNRYPWPEVQKQIEDAIATK